MKNILITRSFIASAEIIRLLESQEFQIFCEPLFTVEKLAVEKISAPISAIIVTSINACFALDNSGIDRETKIFTTGKKTAQELRRIGFKNIILSPRNSAESLFDLVAQEPGQILYFRGSIISLDFAAKLENVRDILAYKTHEVENFSTDFKKIPYDEVLIFSKNSLKIFYKLIAKYNLLEYFASAQIVCLSEQILDLAKKFRFKKICTFADNPLLKKFYD
jgi:uroporphyrinogen-III synthase